MRLLLAVIYNEILFIPFLFVECLSNSGGSTSAPIRKAYPDGSWQEWVMQAYFQRISLSTTGFYNF
jgi:hypothetical protein